MTIARSQQISLEHTQYYHCTSRCVRRAFLCGKDRYSGQDFEHRRQWIEDRLRTLSMVFSIDLVAYAIMSNHYHVVVSINADQARDWSDDEVIRRWQMLYAPPDGPITRSLVERWRCRLMSLSWYMRAINEPIARRANREDKCKGRFWEGRFSSQALLDQSALLKCMAYVELNPIRAKMADTLASSAHTAIKARMDGTDTHLLPFQSEVADDAPSIPFDRNEYFQLVDWTGRALRSDKRGAISPTVPPILGSLDIDTKTWAAEIQHYGKWYYRAVGSISALRTYCEHLGQQWLKGVGSLQQGTS